MSPPHSPSQEESPKSLSKYSQNKTIQISEVNLKVEEIKRPELSPIVFDV